MQDERSICPASNGKLTACPTMASDKDCFAKTAPNDIDPSLRGELCRSNLARKPRLGLLRKKPLAMTVANVILERNARSAVELLAMTYADVGPAVSRSSELTARPTLPPMSSWREMRGALWSYSQ